MIRRMLMVLASVMLAGSLMMTGAEARGGGGHGGSGHMGGGGAHMGHFDGRHGDSFARGHFRGRDGFYDDYGYGYNFDSCPYQPLYGYWSDYDCAY